MEGDDGENDWKRLTWSWKVDPGELRWLWGMPHAGQSRAVGSFLATAIALGGAGMAINYFLHGDDTLGCWRLADSLALLLLSFLMWRGKRWASLGLMALFPAGVVAANLDACMHDTAFYVTHYVNHPAFWLCLNVSSCALWIRVFYMAYRAEGRRAATAALAGK